MRCHEMSGTNLVYDATPSPVLTQRVPWYCVQGLLDMDELHVAISTWQTYLQNRAVRHVT